MEQLARVITSGLFVFFFAFATFIQASDHFKTINDHEAVTTIPTREGTTISFVASPPRQEPKAAAILFVGGHGQIKLWKRPQRLRSNNFLARSRQHFVDRGVFTVTVDVPSNRKDEGLYGFRQTEEHKVDITAVVDWVRTKTRAPLWLIGTSYGTVSVSFLAGALPIDGAIFTASSTKPGKEQYTALDGDLDKVKAPTLIVHHREDGCRTCPLENLEVLAGRLANAEKVEILLFEGGHPATSKACGSQSPHGFLGIEQKVVATTVDWMYQHAP